MNLGIRVWKNHQGNGHIGHITNIGYFMVSSVVFLRCLYKKARHKTLCLSTFKNIVITKITPRI